MFRPGENTKKSFRLIDSGSHLLIIANNAYRDGINNAIVP